MQTKKEGNGFDLFSDAFSVVQVIWLKQQGD
jgi:hypothetical protein